MNGYAAVKNDENSQLHDELLEEIDQRKNRIQVMTSENDELRRQLAEFTEESKKKYDALLLKCLELKVDWQDENDGTSTNANQVTVKTELIFEEIKQEIKEEYEDDHEDDCDGCDRCIVKREFVTYDESDEETDEESDDDDKSFE